MLTQLVHKGVLVPQAPAFHGLALSVHGVQIQLNPEQEEMAIAWARKLNTPYVSDPVFVRNFLRDFAIGLGLDGALQLEDVDFAPAIAVVVAERETRERQTLAERRHIAAVRKTHREDLQQEYGHAIVNAERVDLGNYQVEPSGIFMGRGEHPLRGRWKAGATCGDITLNLSPDALVPCGGWSAIVWQPESLWVARWPDKLTGKIKYIWLSDTAPVKQKREAGKFDKAVELEVHLESVRQHIEAGLSDPKRRQVATVCALIDVLNLRVGDEKDPDEADTVGATTLRPEHVRILGDGSVEFRFLGKDSVLWHKKVLLPDVVRANLAFLLDSASQEASSATGNRRRNGRDKRGLFPDVTSQHVNRFLSEALPGLSAKVFRTHHATRAVREALNKAQVAAHAPDHRKWKAVAMANLEAAIVCNHTRQSTGNWQEKLDRIKERRRVLRDREEQCRQAVSEATEALAALRSGARANVASEIDGASRAKVRAAWTRKIGSSEAKVAAARLRWQKASLARDRYEAQSQVAGKMRSWNPSTSLKSYVDPRVLHRWGQAVGYDVLDKYYPKTMQRKFQWVREEDQATAVDRGLEPEEETQ